MCCSLGRQPSLQRITERSHMLLVFFARVLKSHTNRPTLALQDVCNGTDLRGGCSHPARRELSPHSLNPLHGEVRSCSRRCISLPAGCQDWLLQKVPFSLRYAFLCLLFKYKISILTPLSSDEFLLLRLHPREAVRAMQTLYFQSM